MLTIEPAVVRENARGNRREATAKVRPLVVITAVTVLAWFVLLLWPLVGRNSWFTARMGLGATAGLPSVVSGVIGGMAAGMGARR